MASKPEVWKAEGVSTFSLGVLVRGHGIHITSAKGIPSYRSLYTMLSDPMSGYVSTYLRYYSSLSVCHAVLSILSKGVYEHPSVKRIATESLYIDETCCYPLSLVPLLLKFWWSSSSITTKTGVMWLSPCCHTFRCCSLTVRTLCLR